MYVPLVRSNEDCSDPLNGKEIVMPTITQICLVSWKQWKICCEDVRSYNCSVHSVMSIGGKSRPGIIWGLRDVEPEELMRTTARCCRRACFLKGVTPLRKIIKVYPSH